MILENFSLTDRIAIVTGAGRGIGKGIAIGMAEAGAHVVVVARTAEQIEATAEDIRKLGRKALAVPCNVRNGNEVNGVARKTLDEFGRIDILVNNVGAQFIAPFRKINEKGWDTVMSINLKSVYHGCRAVYDSMYQQKKGCIINISSFVARYTTPGSSHYGAAKAGLENLTKVLAAEWGRYNIRVNVIAPGTFWTSAGEELWADPERREKTTKKIPLRRLGMPEDVAGAAVFLASDAADYITGAILDIDGGPLVMDR